MLALEKPVEVIASNCFWEKFTVLPKTKFCIFKILYFHHRNVHQKQLMCVQKKMSLHFVKPIKSKSPFLFVDLIKL